MVLRVSAWLPRAMDATRARAANQRGCRRRPTWRRNDGRHRGGGRSVGAAARWVRLRICGISGCNVLCAKAVWLGELGRINLN
jgi:hypothetical protein